LDSRGKQLKLVYRHSQVLGLQLPIDGGFCLEFQLRQPLLRGADAGLKLLALQKPFLIGIDQARNPTTNATDQPCELLRRSSCFLANSA
jgi:hypothetical protein